MIATYAVIEIKFSFSFVSLFTECWSRGTTQRNWWAENHAQAIQGDLKFLNS